MDLHHRYNKCEIETKENNDSNQDTEMIATIIDGIDSKQLNVDTGRLRLGNPTK